MNMLAEQLHKFGIILFEDLLKKSLFLGLVLWFLIISLAHGG